MKAAFINILALLPSIGKDKFVRILKNEQIDVTLQRNELPKGGNKTIIGVVREKM